MPVTTNVKKQENKKNINSKKRANDGHTSSKKHKSKKIKDVPSVEGDVNITIRLSDLGIVKRSPSELELQIQSGRILKVLDRTIQKLQIALCLPCLLRNNACVLRRFIKGPELEFIKNVSLKYSLPSDFAQIKQSAPFQAISSVVDKISLHDSTFKRKAIESARSGREQDGLIDPHMAQVIEMLWKARGLKERVMEDFDNIVDVQSMTLVTSIRRLRDIAEKRLATTALEQRAHERRLSKAWKASSEAEANIEKMKHQLEKQRQELGNQVKTKNAIVEDYKNKVEALQLKFKEDIQHKIQESEKDMSEDSNISALRQVSLAAEAKVAVQQYESLLAQHLAYEKSLRAKRFKVETQLCSWLAKYDADIGERQAEFEELSRGYDEEKAEMDALQAKFDEQEEEYVVLMAEKEEEEQRIWEERAYEFLLNRSARKIQRTWRAYRQRKIDRRKARKAKAKAKQEKSGEAAEGGGAPKAAKKGAGKDKKQKGKGKDKGRKDAAEPTELRGPDPMAKLEKAFGGDLLSDLQGGDFPSGEVTVDL